MKKKRHSDEFKKRVKLVAKEFEDEMKHHPFKFVVKSYYDEPFSRIWPLLKAVLVTILCVFALALLEFFGRHAGSVFLVALSDFLTGLVPIFFVSAIISGYRDFFYRKPGPEHFVWPALAGLDVYVSVWIWAQLLGFVKDFIPWAIVPAAAEFLRIYNLEIAMAVCVFCYGIIIVRSFWKSV